MADNELTVIVAGGATKTLRDRDIDAGGLHAQRIDAAPWTPTTTGIISSQDVTTAGVVTLTPPAGSTHLLLTVEDADVRFTENGSTNPTTGTNGIGMLLPAGFIGELALPNPLRFIAVSATAELNGSYRKYA